MEPLAEIVSQGMCAERFAYLHTVPAIALQKALAKAGVEVGELGLIEINEAFAAVAVHANEMLGASEEIVNVNGSSVALGHALGSTGARMTVTLVTRCGAAEANTEPRPVRGRWAGVRRRAAAAGLGRNSRAASPWAPEGALAAGGALPGGRRRRGVPTAASAASDGSASDAGANSVAGSGGGGGGAGRRRRPASAGMGDWSPAGVARAPAAETRSAPQSGCGAGSACAAAVRSGGPR